MAEPKATPAPAKDAAPAKPAKAAPKAEPAIAVGTGVTQEGYAFKTAK